MNVDDSGKQKLIENSSAMDNEEERLAQEEAERARVQEEEARLVAEAEELRLADERDRLAEEERVSRETVRTPSPQLRRDVTSVNAGIGFPKGDNSRKRLFNERESSSCIEHGNRGEPEKRAKGRAPAIPEFGKHKTTEQAREWRDWVDLVYAALRLAPDWDEWETAAWFRIACGRNLRQIIDAYDLEPTKTARPFTRLVENIEKFFDSMTDPALEQQALQQCKQEANETVHEYYLRLKGLVGHRRYDEEYVRMHFVSNLDEASFKCLSCSGKEVQRLWRGWTFPKGVP